MEQADRILLGEHRDALVQNTSTNKDVLEELRRQSVLSSPSSTGGDGGSTNSTIKALLGLTSVFTIALVGWIFATVLRHETDHAALQAWKVEVTGNRFRAVDGRLLEAELHEYIRTQIDARHAP